MVPLFSHDGEEIGEALFSLAAVGAMRALTSGRPNAAGGNEDMVSLFVSMVYILRDTLYYTGDPNSPLMRQSISLRLTGHLSQANEHVSFSPPAGPTLPAVRQGTKIW